MRETVSEKIRQNLIVKSSPNLFWQEIRQIDRPQSRSSRPGLRTCRCAQRSTSFLLGALNNSCCTKVETSIERIEVCAYFVSRASLGVGGFYTGLISVYICGIFAAQSVWCVFKTQRTPNSVVFYSRLGKGLFSQDFTSFLG